MSFCIAIKNLLLLLCLSSMPHVGRLQECRIKKGYPLGRTMCGGGFQQAQTAFPGTVQMSALSACLQVA